MDTTQKKQVFYDIISIVSLYYNSGKYFFLNYILQVKLLIVSFIFKTSKNVYFSLGNKIFFTQDELYKKYINQPVKSDGGLHYKNKWKLRKSMVLLHLNGKLFCGYCGITFDFRKTFPELDHIVPLALGGSDNIRNLTPCCTACNVKKGSSAHWKVQHHSEGFGLKGVKRNMGSLL